MAQVAVAEAWSKNLLGNRWLSACQGAFFVAPSGHGKSAWVIQSAILWSCGLAAFAIKPVRPLRILILQAEDDDNDVTEMAWMLDRLPLSSDQKELVRTNTYVEWLNDVVDTNFFSILPDFLTEFPADLPASEFQFPVSPQLELLQDYCKARFGRGLSGSDLEWLGDFVDGFLAWSENNCGRNREARAAALTMIRLLSAIDEKMSGSADPERDWAEISLALGLPSVCFNHMTGAELASSRGLSKMAVSKKVTRFLRLVELEPAFDGNGRRLVFH